jgi:hypothetical protein
MRNIKWMTILMAALSFGVMPGKAETDAAFAGLDGEVVARIHFAGSAQVSADPQAAEINRFLGVPSAADFREQTLQKLSTAPYRLLKGKIAAQNTNDFAALIRPMLDDLVSGESYIEVRNSTNEIPELLLAVKVSNARAQLWQAYLSTILNSWTAMSVEPIRGDGYTGWQLKKHLEPNLIRFIHAGDWVLFGWGQDELHLQPPILQRIKANQRPADALTNIWLDALVDLPAWNTHHPIKLPLPANLPKLHLTVEGRKDFVRPKVTMLFDQPLGLKLEPWKIPTTYVRNPLASFTAIRGIGPWLGEIPEIKKLNPASLPNQMTFWSIPQFPFGFCAVAPVPGASNYLAKLGPAIRAELNASPTNRPMTSPAVWTNGRVNFTMIFISPYLTSMSEPTGDYLLGSLFPVLPKSNAPPLPRELMQEISNKPNLVGYSWEINSERIMQWQALYQICYMASLKSGPTPASPGIKWLQAIRTNLANCGTEVTLTAPNELTLLRNAPLGLTGLELTGLEYWMDAPEFPLNSVYTRPSPAGLKLRPPKH